MIGGKDQDAYVRTELVALGRVLKIAVGRQFRNISVAVYAAGDGTRMLAYATGDIRDGSVHIRLETPGMPCLWVGRAAFDLDPKEVEPLQQLLAEFSPDTKRTA